MNTSHQPIITRMGIISMKGWIRIEIAICYFCMMLEFRQTIIYASEKDALSKESKGKSWRSEALIAWSTYATACL